MLAFEAFTSANLTLKRLPNPSCLGALALDSLPQTVDLVLVVVSHDSLMPNLAHDGLGSILTGLTAEVDDLATRYAIILAVVEIIRILFAGWENSMCCSLINYGQTGD